MEQMYILQEFPSWLEEDEQTHSNDSLLSHRTSNVLQNILNNKLEKGILNPRDQSRTWENFLLQALVSRLKVELGCLLTLLINELILINQTKGIRYH